MRFEHLKHFSATCIDQKETERSFAGRHQGVRCEQVEVDWPKGWQARQSKLDALLPALNIDEDIPTDGTRLANSTRRSISAGRFERFVHFLNTVCMFPVLARRLPYDTISLWSLSASSIACASSCRQPLIVLGVLGHGSRCWSIREMQISFPVKTVTLVQSSFRLTALFFFLFHGGGFWHGLL